MHTCNILKYRDVGIGEIHTDIIDISIEALLQYLIFESYFNFLLTS